MPLSAARSIVSTHIRIGISLSSIGFSLCWGYTLWRGRSFMDVQHLQSMDVQERAAAVYVGHHDLLKISFRIIEINQSIIASPSGIQNGLNTHHQDQLITLHSLRTMNTISNTSQNFIPVLTVALFFLLYSLYISYSNFVIGFS